MTLQKISVTFLQIVVVLVGIGVLALLLWEPHLEGRNVNATLFQIYFNDPFLAYVYASSIFFFVALYQAFKVLGHVRNDETFSQATIKSLRTVRNCIITLAGLIAAADAYLFVFMRGEDDIAGGVAVSLFLMFVSMIIAATVAVFEGILRKGLLK